MRTFRMIRNEDESGVSGVGLVVEGCLFSDGTVATRWLTAPSSGGTYDSITDFMDIHVNSHPNNRTEIHWSDGEIWRQEDHLPL